MTLVKLAKNMIKNYIKTDDGKIIAFNNIESVKIIQKVEKFMPPTTTTTNLVGFYPKGYKVPFEFIKWREIFK